MWRIRRIARADGSGLQSPPTTGAEMKTPISIAIAGLLCFSNHVSAQSNKELYELQERCGKRAEEFFRREYGTGSPKTEYGITMSFNYENHYSARLNKCFF